MYILPLAVLAGSLGLALTGSPLQSTHPAIENTIQGESKRDSTLRKTDSIIAKRSLLISTDTLHKIGKRNERGQCNLDGKHRGRPGVLSHFSITLLNQETCEYRLIRKSYVEPVKDS